jgi:hypothetical protein
VIKEFKNSGLNFKKGIAYDGIGNLILKAESGVSLLVDTD